MKSPQEVKMEDALTSKTFGVISLTFSSNSQFPSSLNMSFCLHSCSVWSNKNDFLYRKFTSRIVKVNSVSKILARLYIDHDLFFFDINASCARFAALMYNKKGHFKLARSLEMESSLYITFRVCVCLA